MIRVLVVFGVGAIIGDGVLTPAISVLSSVEGLHNVADVGQGIPPACLDVVTSVVLHVHMHTEWSMKAEHTKCCQHTLYVFPFALMYLQRLTNCSIADSK